MAQQISLGKEARADDPHVDDARDDGTHEVTSDIAYKRLGMVNISLFGPTNAGDRGWVLIDTGLPGTAGQIKKAAADRFGKGARPAAIMMTHGHSDHSGSLEFLAKEWDVPVYAHDLERPYLDGGASYPPPDITVGGGVMSLLSPLFPPGPVNVASCLHSLPPDGSVPFMPGWQWLHTPGHTPGHISLWRKSDRSLIVGDAFITTAQESAYAVATQRPEMHGPPMYYTPDWVSAKISVETLAVLEPEVVVTGHGRAMRGEQMRQALYLLAQDFDQVAAPDHGKYVLDPATAGLGNAYAPPRDAAALTKKIPRPISRPLHGVADYLYVGAVAAAPSLLGFTEDKSASTLCKVLGSGTLAYALLTRAEWGLLRVIPFRLHLGVDFLSGLFSLAAPWLLGFSRQPRARNTFIGMGIIGILASLLTKPEEMAVK